MTFQIRDANFGLAKYDAENAIEALAAFLADRHKGKVRPLIEPDGDGAVITIDGETLRAVPMKFEV